MARLKQIAHRPLLSRQYFSLVGFGVCLAICFSFLLHRLVEIQVVRHEELTEAARNNTERTFLKPPRRGDIRDVKGTLLATSKDVDTICADPKLIGTNYVRIAQQIAPVLGLDEIELGEKLRPRLMTNELGKAVEVQYVVLKRKVEPEEWEKVQKAMQTLTFGVDESKLTKKQRAPYHRLRQRAVFATPDQMRFYPNQQLAAHVLGYVGMVERTTPRGKVLETRGADGVEVMMDNVLTGIFGWRETETDSKRQELVAYREQDVAARPGLNVVLTIDSGIQHIVETELDAAYRKHTPISISCLVIRPATGEILALANLPTFNPNKPGDSEPEERRNRVITDNAEPGSTFKSTVIAGALSDDTVELTDSIFCENGAWRYAGLTLHDHHGYGNLTVEGVIIKSSNIGAAKIALKMGEKRLYDVIRGFGFGQITGITLPGEINGFIRTPDRWTKPSITRIPMGHEVAATPLQMAMAMAAIANKGMLMKPMLIDSFVDENNREVTKFQPQKIRQVISEPAAREMTQALVKAVGEEGTGAKAALTHYTVAGKTGTAQKIVNKRYVHDKHFVSFIGFFPAENPELLISVVIDEPKRGMYGGETAAPVFARIGERSANYLAMIPEKPSTNLAANRKKGAD